MTKYWCCISVIWSLGCGYASDWVTWSCATFDRYWYLPIVPSLWFTWFFLSFPSTIRSCTCFSLSLSSLTTIFWPTVIFFTVIPPISGVRSFEFSIVSVGFSIQIFKFNTEISYLRTEWSDCFFITKFFESIDFFHMRVFGTVPTLISAVWPDVRAQRSVGLAFGCRNGLWLSFPGYSSVFTLKGFVFLVPTTFFVPTVSSSELTSKTRIFEVLPIADF